MCRGTVVKYLVYELNEDDSLVFDYDEFSNMICFQQDDRLKTFYKPNLLAKNVIKFQKMKVRDDYLIWREKNGFFTTVDCQNYLSTWSIYTGKLLYKLKLLSDQQIENSEAYRTVW